MNLDQVIPENGLDLALRNKTRITCAVNQHISSSYIFQLDGCVILDMIFVLPLTY